MTLVKLSLGALGALTLAVGAILMAVAIGLFSWIGSDESIAIPEVHLTTTDGMILAEDIELLFDGARFVPDLGTANLTIQTTDGTPIFAGITDQLTASRFLGGDIDPRTQGFWLASAEGSVANLVWDIEPGEWSFVAVNEDGARPTSVIIGGELGAAPFRLAAGTVGGLGLLTLVAGGLLFMASIGLGRRRTPAVSHHSAVPATVGV